MPREIFPGVFYLLLFSDRMPMICRASSEKTFFSSVFLLGYTLYNVGICDLCLRLRPAGGCGWRGM